VIALDASMNARTVTEVARGSYVKTNVYFPPIYTAVLMAGTDRFIVAHNHPNGNPSPTINDINLTGDVMEGANILGLYLEDHWIVTPDPEKSYSFRKSGLLIPAEYGKDWEVNEG
jgi:DNA repair protein RadC